MNGGRRQKQKERQAPKKVDSDDEDEESRAKRLAGTAKGEDETKEDMIADVQIDDKPAQDKDDEVEVTQLAPKRTKTKPKSFLDEILAERSKKKAGKGR